MTRPLLLTLYQALPARNEEEAPAQWAPRLRAALTRFKRNVGARYSEATLGRLLSNPDPEVRQAAVLALGMLGTMDVNRSLADRLHDSDHRVRAMAGEALWSLWFRADTTDNNHELKRLMNREFDESSADAILAGYESLIQKAPRFAEAFNQRAILHFRLGNYGDSLADCERVLKLNPHHFGASSGMAQSYMKLKKYRAALRCYRRALRINPGLDSIRQAIESLEQMLGGS